MRRAVPLAIVALALALLSGCGSSDGSDDSVPSQATAPEASGQKAPAGASAHECGDRGAATALRATGISCERARQLAGAWVGANDCAPAGGASRSSCKLEGDYDCLAVVTDRGLTVSCARPDHSVAFTVKSG